MKGTFIEFIFKNVEFHFQRAKNTESNISFAIEIWWTKEFILTLRYLNYVFFRDFDEIEHDVQECFDDVWGDFDFNDRQTFSRKKREYVAKFNQRAELAATLTHVKAMVLKSHQLFIEKQEVNIYYYMYKVETL